jgi:flagellar biosynthesis/type III secretory pathway protein FliH
MRMLDLENEASVRVLQIYLTPKEAEELRNKLAELLKDPEANEHFHVFADDMSRELSCSIITEKKLCDISGYTNLEKKILTEK